MTDKTITGPFGARQLSNSEWREVLPPLYYLHLQGPPYDSWSDTHFEIATKFCLARCSDWFYYDKHQFVFGSFEDWTLFKLWVKNNNLIEQTEIAIEPLG